MLNRVKHLPKLNSFMRQITTSNITFSKQIQIQNKDVDENGANKNINNNTQSIRTKTNNQNDASANNTRLASNQIKHQSSYGDFKNKKSPNNIKNTTRNDENNQINDTYSSTYADVKTPTSLNFSQANENKNAQFKNFKFLKKMKSENNFNNTESVIFKSI